MFTERQRKPFLNLDEFSATPEQIAQWDSNLRRLQSLSDFLGSYNARMLLIGGVAIEAVCGDHFTRPHKDLDVKIYFPSGFKYEDFDHQIVAFLNTLGECEWYIEPMGDSNLIQIKPRTQAESLVDITSLDLRFFTAVSDSADAELESWR